MDKKGEANAFAKMGAMIMIAITAIVGLVLFSGGIAPNIGAVTLTATYNATAMVGTPVTPGAGVLTELLDPAGNGVQAVSGFSAQNLSGSTIEAANYTITSRQIDNTGELASFINASGEQAGQAWNMTYTYEPLGYINSAGGRSLAGLIAVFTALAILASILFRKELFDLD